MGAFNAAPTPISSRVKAHHARQRSGQRVIMSLTRGCFPHRCWAARAVHPRLSASRHGFVAVSVKRRLVQMGVGVDQKHDPAKEWRATNVLATPCRVRRGFSLPDSVPSATS